MFVFVKALLLLSVFNYVKAECEDRDDLCSDLLLMWGPCQNWYESEKQDCKKTCNLCPGSGSGSGTGSGTGTGSSSSCRCGMKKASRIVGGQETEVNEYPWMASLMWANGGHICGGSLIAANWVVTAAHCFFNRGGTREMYEKHSRIRLGEHDFATHSESSITKTVEVEKIVLHENYNRWTLENDIALVKLSESVDLHTYTPVCLPTSGADFTGRNGWVYGWGEIEFFGDSSDKLLEVQKPVVSDAICRSVMRWWSIKDSMLCAGGEVGKDSCRGDSGGPFTVAVNNQRYLAGVVSWGLECARPNTYGVYSETAKFRLWIDQMMNKNGGGDKCENN